MKGKPLVHIVVMAAVLAVGGLLLLGAPLVIGQKVDVPNHWEATSGTVTETLYLNGPDYSVGGTFEVDKEEYQFWFMNTEVSNGERIYEGDSLTVHYDPVYPSDNLPDDPLNLLKQTLHMAGVIVVLIAIVAETLWMFKSFRSQTGQVE